MARPKGHSIIRRTGYLLVIVKNALLFIIIIFIITQISQASLQTGSNKNNLMHKVNLSRARFHNRYCPDNWFISWWVLSMVTKIWPDLLYFINFWQRSFIYNYGHQYHINQSSIYLITNYTQNSLKREILEQQNLGGCENWPFFSIFHTWSTKINKKTKYARFLPCKIELKVYRTLS